MKNFTIIFAFLAIVIGKLNAQNECSAYFSTTQYQGYTTFYGAAYDQDSLPYSVSDWSWTIDGVGSVSTDSIFSYQFSTNDTFAVCLTIQSDDCYSTWCNNIIVDNNQCNILVTGTVTNASSNEANDGAILVDVSGGAVPYTFFWGDSITTQNRTNLSGGSYFLTVTDDNSCYAVEQYYIDWGDTDTNTNAYLNINIQTTDASSEFECNGTAEAFVSDGTPPFTYSWFNGATSSTTSNLCYGFCTVTVTDATGRTGAAFNLISFPEVTDTTLSQVDTCFIYAEIDTAFIYQIIYDSTGFYFGWSIVTDTDTINILAPYNIDSTGTYLVTLIINCASGSRYQLSFSDIYTVSDGDLLLSIRENFSAEYVKIYPNPVKDVLNINTSAFLDFVEIANSNGQILYRGSQTQINTSKFQAGVYLVKVTLKDSSVKYAKIIK